RRGTSLAVDHADGVCDVTFSAACSPAAAVTEGAVAEDAGTEDAGTEDAGTEDAGTEDAPAEEAVAAGSPAGSATWPRAGPISPRWSSSSARTMYACAPREATS